MASPTKYAIASYWAFQPLVGDNPFVDIGEPACFACEYYHPSWDEPEQHDKRWERAALERAHIVARSIGGSDEPSNFLLLCHECHEAAPMVADSRFMLAWAAKRGNWLLKQNEEIRQHLQRLGVSDQRLKATGKLDRRLMDKAVIESNAGSHFSGERGAITSPATYAAIIVRYVELKEEKRNDRVRPK